MSEPLMTPASAVPTTTVWVGTYPAAGLGTPTGLGEGLWRLDLAADGAMQAHQVSTLPAPSFVVPHPRAALLYVISESAPSALHVVDPEAPAVPLATVTLPGTDSACHVMVAPDGRALYVSTYHSGHLAVVRLGEDGLPLSEEPDQLFAYRGSGPVTGRQDTPHAHYACVSPDGGYVLVADLGSDVVWAHSLGADGLLGEPAVALQVTPGAGPRHIAVRGTMLYLTSELDHQVRTLRWDAASATAQEVDAQPITHVVPRTGDEVCDAHLAWQTSAGAEVLLASVRGPDVIALFDVFPEGELRFRASLDTGSWPRHFAVATDPAGVERLLVVNERGHEVRAFVLADVLALAPESEVGAIAQLPYTSVAVTSPACICPQPA